MAGKPINLDTCRDDFLYQVDISGRLVEAILPLGVVNFTKGKNIHVAHVGRIVELGFMSVAAAWEEFLERTMVRYLTGARTKSGYAAPLKVGACANIAHAYEVISLNPKFDRSRDFLTWTSPREVRMKAAFFFTNGSPYWPAMQPNEQNLGRAIPIRNRVAHASQKCKDEFKIVAREFLAVPKLHQSFTCGDLLQAKAVRHFPKVIHAKNVSLFGAYMELYIEMAKEIVP